MAFDFNKFKDDVMAATKTAGEKGNEALNLAKAKLEIRNKQSALDEQFRLLGEAFYNAHKDDAEVAEYEDFFAEIKNTKKEISDLNAGLLDMEGAVECPVCGKKQKKDHAFCDGCGSPLK